MKRIIAWVLRTWNVGLKIKPQWEVDKHGRIKWILWGITDAAFASSPDDMRSVSGHILFFMGVPILWKSKTQNSVVVSSSEAEFVAASELVKEIMFVIQILEHIGIEVELPVKIYIDNIGSIYMARNNTSITGTKHVRHRFCFCREVHGTLIELIFVRSEDNTADLMTKNLVELLYTKHSLKLVGLVPWSLVPKNKD